MKKEKLKIQWQQIVFVIALLAIGFICGTFLARYLYAISGTGHSLWSDLLPLLGLFIGFYIVLYLQLIIHEAGHLLFGLISGYRFSSFRIGSFIWIKEGEKLRVRRLTIAGTGGQCLMSPPALKDDDIPVTLYNLGGSLLNVITGIVFLLLYWVTGRTSYISICFLMAGILGITMAGANGIPLRMGMVDNDGYNTLSLRRSKTARKAFLLQLMVNEKITSGVRLKDMPEEWFTQPDDEDLRNPIIAAVAVLGCNRLVDELRFAEAEARIAHILDRDTGIVDLHRNLLTCERIYMELIGQNRAEVLESWMTKPFLKFLKSMRTFPPVIRTQYVYALLGRKDLAQAAKHKQYFEKIAKTYPYPNDIQSELELLALAEAKCAEPVQ